MSELKPCPFCGSAAHAWKEYDVDRVTCSDDTCLVAERYGGVDPHIWQSRHIDPATKDQIQADALESLHQRLLRKQVSCLDADGWSDALTEIRTEAFKLREKANASK